MQPLPALILARHGESEASARGVMNGVPGAGVALTDEGRAQAERLGVLLRGTELARCVVTPFPRTLQTAHLALGAWALGDLGRKLIPLEEEPRLSDPDFGAWEGRPLDEYRTWAVTAPPAEPCPGRGESRAAIAARIAAGIDALRHRAAAVGAAGHPVLVVAHSLPIRYLLDAAQCLVPAARAERVPYAEPFRLEADEAEASVQLLARWATAPAWRSA